MWCPDTEDKSAELNFNTQNLGHNTAACSTKTQNTQAVVKWVYK